MDHPFHIVIDELISPRALSLNAFNWKASLLIEKFRGTKHAAGFVQMWREQVLPHLDLVTGIFSPPNEIDQTADSINPVCTSAPSTPSSSTSSSYRTRSNYSNVLIIPNDNLNYLFRSNSIEQHGLLTIIMHSKCDPL